MAITTNPDIMKYFNNLNGPPALPDRNESLGINGTYRNSVSRLGNLSPGGSKVKENGGTTLARMIDRHQPPGNGRERVIAESAV